MPLFTPLLAFLLALLGTVLARWVGLRWGLVDRPGGRRQHLGVIPRVGGIGLFLGFFVVGGGLWWWFPLPPEQRLPLAGVLLGSAVAFVGGLLDDKFHFKAAPQFAVQLGVAVIACATEVFIEQITLPFVGLQDFKPWRWFITYPLTIFWVMGMMNTVNWLDGLDGLATGVGAIAATLFAVHSFTLGQTTIALYALALAGACAGLLVFNFNPARIFLGSAGAMVLGYALATLSILAPARLATALLVMAIPIADTAFQIVDRWRRGASPLQGDRGHLHFRLVDSGLPQAWIVLGYWLFCAAFGTLALLIESRVYKLLAFGVLGVAVAVVLLVLRRRGTP